MPFTASDICKIILAVIFPPLGVFLEKGCDSDLFINILLTLLGYLPGIIHGKFSYNAILMLMPIPSLALYIILKY